MMVPLIIILSYLRLGIRDEVLLVLRPAEDKDERVCRL